MDKLKTSTHIAGIFLSCTTGCRKATTVQKPVKIGIIDVAGNLQSIQVVSEAFKTANPQLVSDVEYIKAAAPELTSKIRTQRTLPVIL